MPAVTTTAVFAIIRGLVAAFVMAVVVAVIASCAYGALRLLVAAGPPPDDVGGSFALLAAFAAYYSASIALPTVIIAGIPLALLSLKFQRTSLAIYGMSGALISFAVIVALESWRRRGGAPFRLDADAYFFAIASLLAGAAAAMSFWKVVRPDRLQHQSLTSR